MDCLVCHDTTGTYVKEPTGAGYPKEDVDLKHVAEQVGHTGRESCGKCHFSGGGGDAIKHADMGSNLKNPDPRCDVHMGDLDFTCAECHTTRQHRIAGRSSSVAPVEGVTRCEDCHSDKPHVGNSLLDHHLNAHGKAMSCNTCHSPVYAKCAPTKTWWDWSKAGDLERKPEYERLGDSDPLPDYAPQKGEFRWKRAARPEYRWYNGYMERINLGDKVDMDAEVVRLTAPVGSIHDPRARITPFKIMKGVQAFDVQHNTLLIPHLFPSGPDDKTAYWKYYNWGKAFTTGMDAAGLPFSGDWEWKETWTFWRVEHEVMPAEQALSCRQCHPSLREERTCDRCHQDSRHVDFKELAHKETDFSFLEGKRENLEELRDSDYIDFKALGYEGDPIIHGGRFKKLPMGRKEDGNN
jgi:octaheme c-type cytochrome (tetrathionate reductase family)